MMTQGKKRAQFTTRSISTIGVLAAVASILFLWEIPIVLFYKLDFSSIPILLGAFSMGPLAGVLIQAVKSLIGLFHSTSQGVGELADLIMGAAMVLPAGWIYRHRKSRRGALLGMALGTLSATLVAVLCNVYLMIPFYGAVYNLPVEAIVDMGRSFIPSLNTIWDFVLLITAPFNAMKWVIISVLTYVLYKPLSPVLHGRNAGSGRR